MLQKLHRMTWLYGKSSAAMFKRTLNLPIRLQQDQTIHLKESMMCLSSGRKTFTYIISKSISVAVKRYGHPWSKSLKITLLLQK